MLVKTNTVVVDPKTDEKFECIVCHHMVSSENFDHEQCTCLSCNKKEGRS